MSWFKPIKSYRYKHTLENLEVYIISTHDQGHWNIFQQLSSCQEMVALLGQSQVSDLGLNGLIMASIVMNHRSFC